MGISVRITFLRNTLQTQCKTLRKPSGDVQRISSFNKREGRPKALLCSSSPSRLRLVSVAAPSPLRSASHRPATSTGGQKDSTTTVHVVAKVVMHRCHRGVEELFVHWKGYDASHGRWVTRASLLQDVPGLVAAYDANPSVLTARRSAPKRATKAPAQPLRRSRRGRAAVHALWTPLGRPVLLRLA